jgi:hypothetical protein
LRKTAASASRGRTNPRRNECLFLCRVSDAGLRRLRGLTTLTRDEMRLAGFTDEVPAIDVCAGIE